MARRKFTNKVVQHVNEPIRLIPETIDYYVSKVGNVYRKLDNGYLPMKTFVNPYNGYTYCNLACAPKGVTNRVHKMVALAWLPNPKNYPIVGHKDNDKSSTCVDDLYWTTISENTQKAFDDGLAKNDKGYDDSQSHPVDVFDKDMNYLDSFGSCRICASKMRVSLSTVARHCKGEIKGKTRCGYYFRYQDSFSNDYRKAMSNRNMLN